MGAAVAACVIVILGIGLVSGGIGSDDSRNMVAGQGENVQDVVTPPNTVAVERAADETPSAHEAPAVPRSPRVLPANVTVRDEPPAIGGNTGSGSTPTPAAPRTRTIRYTVKRPNIIFISAEQQRGDTLSDIAGAKLGSETKWRDIARENGIPFSQAHRIKEGQVLKITVPE